MADLTCDGCFNPIEDWECRIYRGWRFTGTAWSPPHAGDITHMYGSCQDAYVARQLCSGRWAWSQRRVASSFNVSRHTVRKWLNRTPFNPRKAMA